MLPGKRRERCTLSHWEMPRVARGGWLTYSRNGGGVWPTDDSWASQLRGSEAALRSAHKGTYWAIIWCIFESCRCTPAPPRRLQLPELGPFLWPAQACGGQTRAARRRGDWPQTETDPERVCPGPYSVLTL